MIDSMLRLNHTVTCFWYTLVCGCGLKVVQRMLEVMGPRHPITFKGMANLAVTLGEQGKHTEAEAMQRQVRSDVDAAHKTVSAAGA